MILFLDFDGVLHPWDPKTQLSEQQMFSLKPLLENTLRTFPNVEIVITSSWRQKYSLEKLRHLFSPEFSQRIIGVTPPSRRDSRGRYPNGCRGQEILQWLYQNRRNVDQWLALDDLEWMFEPSLRHRLILCDSAIGLTDQKINELEQRLTELMASGSITTLPTAKSPLQQEQA